MVPLPLPCLRGKDTVVLKAVPIPALVVEADTAAEFVVAVVTVVTPEACAPAGELSDACSPFVGMTSSDSAL